MSEIPGTHESPRSRPQDHKERRISKNPFVSKLGKNAGQTKQVTLGKLALLMHESRPVGHISAQAALRNQATDSEHEEREVETTGSAERSSGAAEHTHGQNRKTEQHCGEAHSSNARQRRLKTASECPVAKRGEC